MKQQLMTVDDLCRELGYAKSTVYNLVAKGEIPHIKLSRKALRFRRKEIEKWIEGKAEATSSEAEISP